MAPALSLVLGEGSSCLPLSRKSSQRANNAPSCDRCRRHPSDLCLHPCLCPSPLPTEQHSVPVFYPRHTGWVSKLQTLGTCNDADLHWSPGRHLTTLGLVLVCPRRAITSTRRNLEVREKHSKKLTSMLAASILRNMQCSGAQLLFFPWEAMPTLPDALWEGRNSSPTELQESSDQLSTPGPLVSFSTGAPLHLPGSTLASAWTSETLDFELLWLLKLAIISSFYFPSQWF